MKNKKVSPAKNKEHYPLIRTIYLYLFALVGLALLISGSVRFVNMGLKAFVFTKAEQDMKKPINCATAEGDIRMLQHEKAHVTDQILQGVSSISPAGAVVGLAKGTEGTSLNVTTGKYNKMIDERIAEIKAHCGID